jgi:hypothetical protein
MKAIGPRSIASKLQLFVKILFLVEIVRVLLMALAPIDHYGLQYVSFDVGSGPVQVSFAMLRGAEARWWIWAMELTARFCHTVVLYLLMRILEPAGAGEPFHPKMPNRLRLMGYAVVASALLRTVFCAVLLKRWTYTASGVGYSWAVDYDAIFLGLVLVVLAEVFRRGYALRTESELTV